MRWKKRYSTSGQNSDIRLPTAPPIKLVHNRLTMTVPVRLAEVYERPYDTRQPPITLHADLRPTRPAVPGRELRRDNEFERRGTANVFCAVEPKAGSHFTFPTPDRSAFEFAQVVVTLALEYPNSKTIHMVMDNLINIHCRKSAYNGPSSSPYSHRESRIATVTFDSHGGNRKG